jgi:CTP synthase (UTP-ammonia lyase)
MSSVQIGIIGDYNPDAPTHRATEAAIGHAAAHLHCTAGVTWLPTAELSRPAAGLAAYDALWCAPGSPYRSMEGALAGIRFARESGRPFLGTCGGFQHAVIEYARNVLGFVDAQHAEYDPYASRLVVTPLSCSLVGQTMTVHIDPGSCSFQAYGCDTVREQYYCNFGLNPAYRALLREGGLRFAGVDQEGEARIMELPSHPFFIATLFVPQMDSTPERPHPLIRAYVRAAMHCHSAKGGVVAAM